MNLRARLIRRAADSTFVRIERGGRDVDTLDGVVTAVGPKWFVLASDHAAGFAGHCLLRVRDVVKVTRSPGGSFLEQAWCSEDSWPPPRLPDVPLDRSADLLRFLEHTSPAMSIHYEYDHPDECLVGLPTRLRRRRFVLQTISPQAEWDGLDPTIGYREVSRIDVDGPYERRLLRVGGPPPTRVATRRS